MKTRKIISAVLCMTMAFSLSVAAFAADTRAVEEEDGANIAQVQIMTKRMLAIGSVKR